MLEFFLASLPQEKHKVYNNKILYLEESIHVAFEETQNEKIVEILDNINESIQHLSLNDKTIMKDDNEGMDKDQPNTNNQQEMVSNSFVPLKELRYASSHSLKLIIGNPFEGIKTITSLKNKSDHFVSFFSHI